MKKQITKKLHKRSSKTEVSRESKPKDETIHPNLGDFVRETRKAQNLTQKQVASLSGTSFNFISQLESGKPTVRWSHVIQVLHVLGIKLECKWGENSVSI